MPISNLTIPFPDFKYGEIMNPDAFDTNNEAIKTKVNEIIVKSNDLDNKVIDTGWIGADTLGFLNGWVYVGYGAFPAYRKKNGIVYLRGLIASGTAGLPMFRLPVGYRPDYSLAFPVITGNNAPYRLDVTDMGDVLVAGGANTGFVFLNTVLFPV